MATNNRVKNVNGLVGEGVEFERIRRITGYLTTVKRANNAKTAEMKDRLVHSMTRATQKKAY